MFEPIPALAYFQLLVRGPNEIPLLEAATSIGVDAYPDMDLQGTMDRFDELARRLAERCRNDTTDMARLQTVIHFMYGELGFAGNVNHYYDPDNSYLHRVLDTRRGIPITLGLVFRELARHVGLPVEGVSFPGHFLVRIRMQQGMVVIDPFAGKSLEREELLQWAAPYPFSVAQLLQPATSAQILVRLLHNVLAIHEEQGRTDSAEKVNQRLRILETETGTVAGKRA